MTVSEPIAYEYKKLYNVLPLVVRNVGRNTDNIIPYKREEMKVSEYDLLIILQGAGINMDKGAEELLDSINISEGITLLIIGSGDVIPQLKQRVKELNIENKVKILPLVPWNILMKYTKSADIGMCLEKDTNLNYRYSLPNKLFDYISAGIPILSSDLPETGKIIREYRCGQVIPSVTPEFISKTLSEVMNDRKKLAEFRRNSVIASKDLNWDIESKKVIELYSRIFNEVR